MTEQNMDLLERIEALERALAAEQERVAQRADRLDEALSDAAEHLRRAATYLATFHHLAAPRHRPGGHQAQKEERQ